MLNFVIGRWGDIFKIYKYMWSYSSILVLCLHYDEQLVPWEGIVVCKQKSVFAVEYDVASFLFCLRIWALLAQLYLMLCYGFFQVMLLNQTYDYA